MTDNLKQRIAEALRPLATRSSPNASQYVIEQAAQAVLDIVEPMISKWVSFPENRPVLYAGLKVSKPLLFEVKHRGGTFVYFGFYDDADGVFYETGDLIRINKQLATRFCHVSFPPIEKE